MPHLQGDKDLVDRLAANLAKRIAQAREELQSQMLRQGLTPTQGWLIREEIRSGFAGTVIALHPMHFQLDGPDFETTIQVGQDGRLI